MATKSILEHQETALSTFASTFKTQKRRDLSHHEIPLHTAHCAMDATC